MSKKDKPSPDVGRTIKKGPKVYQSVDPQDLPAVSKQTEATKEDGPPQPSQETPNDTSDSSSDDV